MVGLVAREVAAGQARGLGLVAFGVVGLAGNARSHGHLGDGLLEVARERFLGGGLQNNVVRGVVLGGTRLVGAVGRTLVLGHGDARRE